MLELVKGESLERQLSRGPLADAEVAATLEATNLTVAGTLVGNLTGGRCQRLGQDARTSRVTVIQNLSEELKQRVPTGR